VGLIEQALGGPVEGLSAVDPPRSAAIVGGYHPSCSGLKTLVNLHFWTTVRFKRLVAAWGGGTAVSSVLPSFCSQDRA
jgi:hypothetical protein